MQTVCRLSDIDEPGARGFELATPDGPRAAFVVRALGGVRAYLNVCPHAGNRLDWQPDAFLTRDRSQIICAVHGATFDIASGECNAGPCPGKRLVALNVNVKDGWVVVGAETGSAGRP